jgi:flagellar protein FlbD
MGRRGILIRLTRLSGDPIFVNVDLIETIESTPDTILTLTTGNRLTVRETPEQIASQMLHLRQEIHARAGTRA